MWERLAECREWLWGWTGISTGSLVSLSILFLFMGNSAMYYRPVPDYIGGGKSAGLTRLRELEASRAPVGLVLARWFVQFVTVTAMKVVIGLRNTVDIAKDSNYRQALSLMRKRPAGVPLLTVSNHVSSMDDPGLISCLIPFDVLMTPNRVRWGIATQEIVFPQIPWANAFMGAGQVLPICRGGGIDQGLFMDFARVLAAGRWGHIFPEGRVIQTGTLGRDPITKRSRKEEKEKGRLKWGVGKLVAHSPVTPVLVPFYHLGMASVLPQHNVWEGGEFRNGVVSWRHIQGGHRVKVWFGDRVPFDDLLAAHERAHGPLWKLDTAPTADRWTDVMHKWESSGACRSLYSAITRRVQDALLRLEERARKDTANSTQPDFKPACPRAVAATPPEIASRPPAS